MCAHSNPLKLRLMTYTPYGPMVGCLVCGTAWLVNEPKHTPASLAGRRSAQ